jgi:Cytochrome P450
MQIWSQALIDGVGNYADDATVWSRGRKAGAGIDAAVARARDRARAGTVIHAMLSDAAVTYDEVLANVKLFISGGLNEPRDVIATTTWALLRDAEQAALVRADPAAFAAATEESLRWMSPIAMYPRYVSSDTRLGGVELAAGSRVGVLLASANRDERHWEEPDRFDLRRATQRHVAFSRGPHVCLGAFVARQQVGRARLFERLPGLRLATGFEPQQVGWVFRCALVTDDGHGLSLEVAFQRPRSRGVVLGDPVQPAPWLVSDLPSFFRPSCFASPVEIVVVAASVSTSSGNGPLPSRYTFTRATTKVHPPTTGCVGGVSEATRALLVRVRRRRSWTGELVTLRRRTSSLLGCSRAVRSGDQPWARVRSPDGRAGSRRRRQRPIAIERREPGARADRRSALRPRPRRATASDRPRAALVNLRPRLAGVALASRRSSRGGASAAIGARPREPVEQRELPPPGGSSRHVTRAGART